MWSCEAVKSGRTTDGLDNVAEAGAPPRLGCPAGTFSPLLTKVAAVSTSKEWTRTKCQRKLQDRVERCGQNGQRNGFSPVWVLRCRVRSCLQFRPWQTWPQYLQDLRLMSPPTPSGCSSEVFMRGPLSRLLLPSNIVCWLCRRT